MILPEDNTDNRPSQRRTGIIAAVLLFLAVLSVAFYTYMQSQNIDMRSINPGQLFSGFQQKTVKPVDAEYEIPYDSKDHPAYVAFGDYLAKCTADGLKLLDKKGQEVSSEGMALTRPLVKVNGSYLLVADIGGFDIYVIKGRNVIWREKTDNSIVNAEINSKGYVTAVTESKQYNGEVDLFDPFGQLLYKSMIANDFAVMAQISEKSRNMVINSLNTQDVEAATALKFYNIDGKEIGNSKLGAGGDIYPSIWYMRDDSLFAAGDSSIAYIDKNMEPKWEKKYARITGAAAPDGSHIAAIVQGAAGYELKVLASSGQESSSRPLDGDKAGITARDGVIALNTLREAEFYNIGGGCIGKYSSSSDILEVSFFNKHQAAVITKAYIAIVNI